MRHCRIARQNVRRGLRSGRSAAGRVAGETLHLLSFSQTDKLKITDSIMLESCYKFPVEGHCSPAMRCLGLHSHDGPGGQRGDDAERQIYQQQIEREHGPSLPKPKDPRAAHRQKD